VRRWTKRDKVDLFERDLVIVPINCNQSHWTLALINVKVRPSATRISRQTITPRIDSPE